MRPAASRARALYPAAMRSSAVAPGPQIPVSAAGGASISIRLRPSSVRSRSNLRVEASPGRGWRFADARPAPARKSAFRASRSELKRSTFPCAMAGQARAPRLGLVGQHYIESVGRQATLESLGPFDQDPAILQRLVQPDLIGLLR